MENIGCNKESKLRLTRSDILSQASDIVNGAREQEYNSPENSFPLIAAYWSTYKGIKFSPVDVAMMMALLKVARIQGGHYKFDSYVDLLGYGAIAGELAALEENE